MGSMQVLMSLILFDALFYGWQQLPFTCSYMPGKRPMIAIVAAYMGSLCAVVPVLSVWISAATDFPPLPVLFGLLRGDLDLGAQTTPRWLGRRSPGL